MMNKAELLTDLVEREWVHSLVGNPIDVTPNNEIPANLKWYHQVLFETSPDGKVLRKGKVSFYVLDEGTEQEMAAYQESEPQPTTQTQDFAKWLDTALATEALAGHLDAWEVIQLSERYRQGLIRALIDDPSKPGELTVASYLVRQLPNGSLWKKKVNLSADQLMRGKL